MGAAVIASFELPAEMGTFALGFAVKSTFNGGGVADVRHAAAARRYKMDAFKFT